jgi:hypothetical protein
MTMFFIIPFKTLTSAPCPQKFQTELFNKKNLKGEATRSEYGTYIVLKEGSNHCLRTSNLNSRSGHDFLFGSH